jgi:tRNA(Glu) U13 pseudouridine synthase TruD
LVGEVLRSASVPLLAPSTPLLAPWGSAVTRVLQEEGLGLDDLWVRDAARVATQPRFEPSSRPLFAVAQEFELAPLVADGEAAAREGRVPSGARRLRFTLPRGAYATVLLRALSQ